VRKHEPQIVGMSAFLTTTMPMLKVNIEALKKAGLRDKVKVMVGGAPVTQEYANRVGADAYCGDASATARQAKEFLGMEVEVPSGRLAAAVAAVEQMMSLAHE
jgi:5-methyltetrahydrofolate--homocysteine methyltransferase